MYMEDGLIQTFFDGEVKLVGHSTTNIKVVEGILFIRKESSIAEVVRIPINDIVVFREGTVTLSSGTKIYVSSKVEVINKIAEVLWDYCGDTV